MFSSIELPSPSSMSVALNQWKKWHFLPHDPVNGQIKCMSAVATFFIIVRLCLISCGKLLVACRTHFCRELDTTVIFPAPPSTQSVIQLSVTGLSARCQIYHTYILLHIVSSFFCHWHACTCTMFEGFGEEDPLPYQVIQRRGNFGEPRENFTRSWEEYKQGFGDLEQEFWWGNDKISRLTREQSMMMRIELEAHDGRVAIAEYDTFR